MVIIGKRYICNDCGYKWKSKKFFGEPAFCPRCKSGDIERYSLIKFFSSDEPLINVKIVNSCGYCGKKLDSEKDVKGYCKSVWCSQSLCKKCVNKCKKCHKIFCPKHIKKHKCYPQISIDINNLK